MPGGSEPSQLGAAVLQTPAGPVLGNTTNLPAIKTSVAVRRFSSTDSHQTFNHLPTQPQRLPKLNEQLQHHNSESPTSQQSTQNQMQHQHATKPTHACKQPSPADSQQPGATAAAAGQHTASDLAAQLLQLPISSITDFASQYTLEELREVLGHLHHSQLQQLHEQLLQLQGQQGGKPSCPAGQSDPQSAQQNAPPAAGVAAQPSGYASRLRSRSSKQTNPVAARPPTGSHHMQQHQQPEEQQQEEQQQQQQQQDSAQRAAAQLAALAAAAENLSADEETEACVAVKPIDQCSAEQVDELHCTCLRARFERLSAEQQGGILLELEQLEELEQARRAKRAKREAAAAARAEAAAAVQLRKSTRQRKHVDLDGDTDHAAQDNSTAAPQHPPAAAAAGVVAQAGAFQQLQRQSDSCHQAVQQQGVTTAAAAAGIAASGGSGQCIGSSARVGKRARGQPSSTQESTPEPELAACCADHTDRKYACGQGKMLATAAVPAMRRCGSRAQARKHVHVLRRAPMF